MLPVCRSFRSRPFSSPGAGRGLGRAIARYAWRNVAVESGSSTWMLPAAMHDRGSEDSPRGRTGLALCRRCLGSIGCTGAAAAFAREHGGVDAIINNATLLLR